MYLLKEYKREIVNYLLGAREDYPPVPKNYFDTKAQHTVEEFKRLVIDSDEKNELMQKFPEELLRVNIKNTWASTARTIFNNWLGAIANDKKNTA